MFSLRQPVRRLGARLLESLASSGAIAKIERIADWFPAAITNCFCFELELAEASSSADELCDAAHRPMSAVLCRAAANGAFQLDSDDSQIICNPGLFKGLSGIGYTCLRLADVKNVLPSVLLME